MRKGLLILIFTSSLYFTAQSQVYVPFPNDTARWNCLYWWNGTPNNQWFVNYQYIMNGDTLIGSKQYRKVYYNNVDDQIPRQYIGGLREDSIRRIFFFPCCTTMPSPSFHQFPVQTAEQLLYTFNNLSVGDTLPININNTKIVVMGIDSILIGGNMRKRYEVRNPNMLFNPEYWIEGIGSTKDLLSPYTYEFEWELISLCYHDTDIFYFNPPGAVDSCHYTYTGIDAYEPLTYQIIVSPNPATDHLNIQLPQIDENTVLTIYDQLGKAIKIKAINNKEASFNISGLSRGVYILEVATEKAISREKFVKE
jgi:hypothetical protein